MRKRIVAAALLTAALAVAASTAMGATSKASANSITVWLQADATADNWKPITAAATAAFQAKHPSRRSRGNWHPGWKTRPDRLDLV